MASSSSAAASAEVKPNTKALLAAIKQLAPPLSLHSHKGQSGRVGVIGGSKAYTGAPYFSAQCCLSMGADLVTLFCSVEAALAIKAYSPDLMVRPTLFPAYKAQEATAELDAAAAGGDGKDKEKDKGKSLVERLADDIEQWSAKLDVQVLGPGLGKDELISQTVGAWIVKQSRKGEGSGSSDAKEKEKQQPSPLVIDGDGIHVFQHYTSGRATHASAFNAHVVLTPNAAEFRRLWQHFVGEGEKGTATAAAAMPLPNFDVDANDQWLKDNPDGGEISVQHPLARETAHLADVLGGVTIVRKGFVDVISNGRRAVIVSSSSNNHSPRRVGGQGDVLAGATGMFLTWTRKEQERKEKERKEKKETGKSVQGAQEEEELLPPAMLAAWSAAHFCRALGGRAYARHGRSMLASHLLLHLPEVLHEWFPLDGVKITPKL